MLGVIASHLNFYGPSALFVELDRQALKWDYSLLPQFIHDAESNGSHVLKILQSQQVDGVLWAVASLGDEQVHPPFDSVPVPLVSIGDPVEGVYQPVVIDEVAGARLAVEHLLAQGYHHISLIIGPARSAATLKRREGWEQTLSAAGLTSQASQIIEGDWTAESGEQCFYRLLTQYPELDAVFACNDQMALGVLLGAHRIGRLVPDSLGVVGFDDFPESACFWPPLTTVRQPWAEKCGLTVQTLIRIIEERLDSDDGAYTIAEPYLLPAELIVRESSVRKAR